MLFVKCTVGSAVSGIIQSNMRFLGVRVFLLAFLLAFTLLLILIFCHKAYEGMRGEGRKH